jgi:hypothetical protein
LRKLVEPADQTIVQTLSGQTIMQYDDSNLETDEEAIIIDNATNLDSIATTRLYGGLRKRSS